MSVYRISDETIHKMYCTFKYPRASDGAIMCGRRDRQCDGDTNCPYSADELERIFKKIKRRTA